MKYLVCLVILLAGAVSAPAELVTEVVEYKHGDAVLEGYMTYDNSIPWKRPGVLVVHEWWGLNLFVMKRAEDLARLGYVAFAVDMYGKGQRAADAKEAETLSAKYRGDRELMRARARAGLEVLMHHRFTDQRRTAAMGYCFGGMTVLEMARGGSDVLGVVSFHGGLDTQNPGASKGMKARVLVLHGADDPFISPQQVSVFQDEMRKAGADWQMVFYGGAAHGFTNPGADSYQIQGVGYNEKADKRSWEAMRVFFEELFR